MASMTMISIASGSVQLMAATPATASTRIISSGPYADELMLSLLKIASAFRFERRSWASRWLLMGGKYPAQRRGPAGALQDGALAGDQRALPAAALELVLERAHDLHVGVAGALAALLLADLQEWVDGWIRFRASGAATIAHSIGY